MKGLNKLAIIAAIGAATSAHAELVTMDDEAMSATTGQAGLTIDINDAELTIGAIDYKDQGFISIKNVRFGGGADGILDNIRMTIDVAGDGSDLGESKLGETYISNAAALVGGQVSGNYVSQTVDDGDLVIAFRTVDLTNIFGSVDYGLEIGSVGLGKSTETEGSVNDGTILLSNLDLQGYLGPIDVIVDGNNGGVNISAYFNASGSLDMPFMAVKTDLFIHNSRGSDQVWLDTQSRERSMAHVQINVSKEEDYLAAGQTALRLNVQNFEADIDLENFTLGTFTGGDGRGIGDIYITDLRMRADTVIFGH